MDRTVVVSIDDDVLEFELEQPDEMNEDDFYHMVVDYIMSNIQVEIF